MTSLFVTLTYATGRVPITSGMKGHAMSLRKTDVQKFMKRLRKIEQGNNSIKYFAVGEYGSKGERPHYHAIIFNANRENIERAWALDNKKIGEIHIGSVTEASIVYTLKYMCKHMRIRKDDPYGREREFRLMSKGMGEDYVTEQMKKWHLQDPVERMYIPLKDGKKIAMPRYYKDRIYTEKQRGIIAAAQRVRLNKEDEKLRAEVENYELHMMNVKEAQYKKHEYRSKTRQKL